MRINLRTVYRGKLTNEQPINPGTYDADAPELMGLAQYLVNNGHAVVVMDPASKPVPKPESQQPAADVIHAPTVETEDNPYEKWGIDLLRTEVKWREIADEDIPHTAKNGTVTKADLIVALRANDSGNTLPG